MDAIELLVLFARTAALAVVGYGGLLSLRWLLDPPVSPDRQVEEHPAPRPDGAVRAAAAS